MALQKLAHAVLRVQEMETALEFHTEILGLTELGHNGNTVYLGCGVDDNFGLYGTFRVFVPDETKLHSRNA